MVGSLKLLAPHHGSVCWDLASVPGAFPGETTASAAPGGKRKHQNKGKKKQLVPLVRLRSRHGSLGPLGLDVMLEGFPKVTRLWGGGVVLF